MEWSEPIESVQSIAESGVKSLPNRYIKPEPQRPHDEDTLSTEDIPVVDISGLKGELRSKTMDEIAYACKEWGFFQVINHGIPPEILKSALDVSRRFFTIPLKEKQKHANNPLTYEGYGSRIGVQKGALLDWGDYYYHHYMPLCLMNENKWPSKPEEYRPLMKEYCRGVIDLCLELLSVFSANLGLDAGYLKEAFGGEENIGMCVRINYYPPCPEPDLTLGLSSHSDPGGVTFLLQDDIPGLQVRKGERWITVTPIPNAFVVNLGDQIQIYTNGMYRSVEHRALVNKSMERISIAGFCNPCGDKEVGPITKLIYHGKPAVYKSMTFNQYRTFIRTYGTKGKAHLNSIVTAASTEEEKEREV